MNIKRAVLQEIKELVQWWQNFVSSPGRVIGISVSSLTRQSYILKRYCQINFEIATTFIMYLDFIFVNMFNSAFISEICRLLLLVLLVSLWKCLLLHNRKVNVTAKYLNWLCIKCCHTSAWTNRGFVSSFCLGIV